VTPARPEFELSLGLDRYDVPPGSIAPLIVQTVRRGYAGPIDVIVVGAGFKGETVIPAGQAFATLVLEADPSLQPGPHAITLQGKATIDGTIVTEAVSVRKALSDSLGGLPLPPRQLDTRIAVAVTQKPPFQLTARVDPGEVIPGRAADLTVTVARAPGFAEAIALSPPEGLPAGMKPPVLKPIPKDQNEVKVKLDVDLKAPLGKYLLTFTGKATIQKKEVMAYVRPATLIVTEAFDLKVEPAAVNLTPAGKVKLKVVAARHGGYDGPIAVELRNLPAKVTAGKAEIAKGQDAVDIELTAAADVPPGASANVNVLGTAVALNNRQNASPNFSVNVAKK
jgi:hypothetical protein